MANRYLITGVQLALLIESKKIDRKKLIDNIIDKQFVFSTYNQIEDDVKDVAKKGRARLGKMEYQWHCVKCEDRFITEQERDKHEAECNF